MDKRSRKYQLTFNNPELHNVTHETINECMKQIHWVYYCMQDEIGLEEKTPHIHLYYVCENAIGFNKVKRLFPSAHIEQAYGTSKENRDYVTKSGKWETSEKHDTSLPDTFEEYGEMPLDEKSKNLKVSEQVLEMIENNCSNNEIIHAFPSYSTKINQLNQIRQTVLEDRVKNSWRNLTVVYAFGPTGTGKTRSVMEQYGYSNVCKISDYSNHPYDNYDNQKVLLLDEFYGGIPFNELLQLLDGYPYPLSCRYANKWALFDTVYIISNIDLKYQYTNIQNETNKWNALIRRITNVIEYTGNGYITFHEPSSYLLEG